VTPLGLLNDEERKVKFYLDEAFSTGLIGVHPNDNTATIWMQTADLVRIISEHGNNVEIVNLD
jgi:Ala-tRNA(Pro) deacylase